MTTNIPDMLRPLAADSDGILGTAAVNTFQSTEQRLRDSVAAQVYEDYLNEISKHHSIEVMDKEVAKFVANVPRGGTILDVGGCWGWHWRNTHLHRPDLKIVIVDFVRNNLLHAKQLLKGRIGQDIWLVHGDATKLDFPANVFDGYWSVQTLQHIPQFDAAVAEAVRVLKPGGVFATYSLNDAPIVRLIYALLRREYVRDGMVAGRFYLKRADKGQRDTIERLLGSKVEERFSEILFKPELRLRFMGKQGSVVGKADSHMSGRLPLAFLIARQHSYHTKKK